MVWRLLLLCTCGAVGGGLAEYVHMHAEVWSLPYGQEFPLWIVWVYFCALLGLGLLFARFAHVWRVPGVSRRTLLMELAALNFLAALPPLLHHYEVALAGLVALYLVLRFWLTKPRRKEHMKPILLPALRTGLYPDLYHVWFFRHVRRQVWV